MLTKQASSGWWWLVVTYSLAEMLITITALLFSGAKIKPNAESLY